MRGPLALALLGCALGRPLDAESLAWKRLLDAGKFCADHGRYAEAEQWFQRGLALGKAGQASPLETALARYGLGRVALAGHRYREAEAQMQGLEAALAGAGADFNAYGLTVLIDRARVQSGLGRPAEARKLIQSGLDDPRSRNLASAPNRVTLWLMLGDLDREAGRPGPARASYQQALDEAGKLWDGKSRWAQDARARLESLKP